MVYNGQNPLDVQNARLRLDNLISRGCIFELTEKKPKRSLSQNAYLHTLLGYFASQTGNTLEWVKQQYYKKTCNPDLYVGEKQDKFIGRVLYVRSSTDLSTEEMNLSIERFRNWSAMEAGIYLPEPTNEAEIAAMQIEVEKYKTYLY